MSTDIISYCCKELQRHVQAPKTDDKYKIVYVGAPGFEWFIYDKEIKDTYPMDECVFCGKKL